jgi:hypothetical protein
MLPVGPLAGSWREVKKSCGISRPRASRLDPVASLGAEDGKVADFRLVRCQD